jgi:predicted dehydrogenase
VAVGFKKMFFPANVKAKQIISETAFGAISTITARYPQILLPADARGDHRKMIGFLDHMVHPYSLLVYLAGAVESMYVQCSGDGGSITSLRFRSGAVGALHLPAGQGAGAPQERTEIVGAGGNVVVDNNIRVNYYPAGAVPEGGYVRAGDWYGQSTAALSWEPEFSLGQLYNKGIFLLGYAPEMRYFCDCVLNQKAPEIGSLRDALHLLRIYEAYCEGDGVCRTIEMND